MCTYYPNLVNENNHILLRIIAKYIFLIGIVINLFSCQPSTQFKSTPINNCYTNHSQADSLIRPYKTKLDAEMNEVLVISAEEFPKEKGKLETKLGNLVADLCFNHAGFKLYQDSVISKPDFCLLNFGGLRTSLPKGEITRGKIFELMPFENELVLVTIDPMKMIDLKEYLREVGGQPVSGITITLFNSGASHTCWYKGAGPLRPHTVLTTDYLANGGDNMNFFKNPIKTEYTGLKLRDAIINYCRDEHKKGNQLTAPTFKNRITIRDSL